MIYLGSSIWFGYDRFGIVYENLGIQIYCANLIFLILMAKAVVPIVELGYCHEARCDPNSLIYSVPSKSNLWKGNYLEIR